ncbi:MAG: restriction endonuclease subunit S [Gammaproteobacteria bacterium]|nr:restriction endonuclease subunit S [Gammaproteobacteria bacterium]
MLRQEPKYESYKDSGVPWIGTIPTDWKLVRNKTILSERTGTVGKRASEYTLLSLTLCGVVPRDMENPMGKFPAEFDTYKIVEPDDLIFCLFDVAETPRTVGRSQKGGMITGAYTILKPRESICTSFLHYFYLSLDYDKRLSSLYTGLRNVIKIDTFMSIKTPVPDFATQNRIVKFLDEKTAEIDAAIANKRRLIELLNEQKTILINRAVTKGLNPNAPMKDSGVDWIGEIPAHWEVLRLETIATYNDDTVNERQYQYRSIKYVDISSVDAETNQYAYEEQAFVDAPLRARRLVQKGDTIISTVRPYLKAVATLQQADPDLVVSTGFAVARPKQGTDARFLGYVIRNDLFIGEVVSNSVGASYPAINTSDLFKIRIPVPDLLTQNRIVNFLDEKTAETDATIAKERRSIDLLNEFKQILIANAVTGKIRI